MRYCYVKMGIYTEIRNRIDELIKNYLVGIENEAKKKGLQGGG